MKQKFKFLLLLAVVATLFVNCEKEDINSYENNNSLKISSRKATVNEVLHKINNPSIKQKIVYENNRIIGKNNDISANQNLRINSQDSIFTVIEKENDFTTYLLPINSYTTENPFFLKYIITVDVNNIEKSGYIKYIPSTPTGNLNLGTFSGTVEVYNIEDELIGLTTFVNGIAQPQTSNSNNRVICYDQVTINEVTCSHGGGHGVGESCEEGFINDAYWYVSITTVCNYDPTTIVQIIDDSSNPSMGGGSSNLNPNTTTLNKIINNLTMAQIDWWYSQNTSQETRDAIVNYVNQNNSTQNEEEQAIDFVKELIDYCVQENNSQDSIDEIKNILDILDDGMINGEQVVVGPDIPITNMADYLDCFDTSQPATITIYADQPKNGSHNLYGEDGVGHAFISIKQGTNVATLGFYPISTVGSAIPNNLTLDPKDFFPTPGIFGNDEGHTFDVSISVPIDSNSLTNLINGFILLANNNPMYNLGSNNCTDIAITTFESVTSVNIPDCESPRFYWDGQTPGTLGEVLSNISTPVNGTKNTNGGSAPNNNCN